jgi:hypothetical protein
MISIDAAIAPFQLNTSISAPHMVQVREGEPSSPIHLSGARVRFASGKDDLVITPGGPRRRDQVHHVGPGETVRQNEDGTYTVVPKEPPTGPKPKDQSKKEK